MVLLERDRELHELDAVFAGALAARGRVGLVRGPAGIGKTELINAAVARARGRDQLVLAARGGELEGDLPFGVVRQLFEDCLRRMRPAARHAVLAAGAAAAEGLLGVGRTEPGELGGDAAASLRHALYRLTLNLAARQPIGLVVDDLQWSDPASLRWLAYLARRVPSSPVALVLAVRSGDPGAASADVDLIEDVATTVQPRPLSGAGADALLARELGRAPDPAFGVACLEATGGNPLLLHELAAILRAEGLDPVAANLGRLRSLASERLARSIARRIARIPGPAAAVARAVAILEEGEPRDVAALAGCELGSVARAADDLQAADVLRPGRPLRFVHPLVRTAVYSRLAPAERAEGHASAARALAHAGAPRERIAAHLQATDAAGDSWVVDALAGAAEAALARGTPEIAVRHLRRALEEPPPPARRPRLLLDLGEAEARAHYPAAEEHLRAALATLHDPAARATAASALGHVLIHRGRTGEAIELVAGARDQAARIDPELALGLEVQLLTAALVDPCGREELDRRLPRLERGVQGRTPAGRAVLGLLAFFSMTACRRADHGLELARRAVADGRLFAELTPDHPALYAAVQVAVYADRLELAERWFRLLADEAHRRGSVGGIALTVGWQAEVALRRGALADAEAQARRALALGRTEGVEGAVPTPLACLLEVLIARGRFAEAERLLDELDLATRTDSPFIHFVTILAARGRLWIEAGQAERGVADALLAGERLDAHGYRNPALVPWRSVAASGLFALGRRDEALGLARDELRLARAYGAPRALAVALRCVGVLTRGVAELREAVALSDRAPHERAHALVELGAALRRDGQRVAARRELAAGLELARRCGADALAQRARDELAIAGARPRRERLSGPEALTAGERRVAELAAQGKSNREIAQELFVTVKAVEWHLSHAYAKLGIRSRRELPRAIGENPGGAP